MHLPCLTIGSAGALGTANGQRSCAYFTARLQRWLVSGDLNPNGALLFDLYVCRIVGALDIAVNEQRWTLCEM